MKYRILTNEELSYLEEDLKQFLIVNGVHSEDWAILNKSNPEKAIDLVAIFSDNVLQKVYEKLEYLEFRTAESCLVFHCLPDKIEMISIQRKEGSQANLETVESIHISLTKSSHELSFFRTDKLYNQEREMEIHRLIEQGCHISSQEFWDSLSSALS
jgi:hypothetical protein